MIKNVYKRELYKNCTKRLLQYYTRRIEITNLREKRGVKEKNKFKLEKLLFCCLCDFLIIINTGTQTSSLNNNNENKP